ncbi:SDR family oxidoreductase [Streptomyces sp. NPDC049954]|uniref:SDR family oxidoreductase n=1 Tax=Streptomyces sp. NPDC049954 TaxID=3155779 RepID=UPI00342BB718
MKSGTSPLQGRTVVVTGAARGLGRALAERLAGCGARLALVGRNTDALGEVAASLPAEAECWEADVTDHAALADVSRHIRERFGPPSVVIANAGVAEGGPFLHSDPVTWRRVIDVNLVGSANTARAFLPDLLASRGYFLQIASLASMGTSPMMSAYCASKAGVEAFAHSLRAEVAHEGVGVGIAYLNWMDTDMTQDSEQFAVLRELRAHEPAPARKVFPASEVADRMVRTIERRRGAVYVPGWLRSVQAVRGALPLVVLAVARRELPRIAQESPITATGLLGAGARDGERPGPSLREV